MRKIGILGGTFDPIHIGHLITARAVKEMRGLAKIIFIPAFISPHKTNAKAAPASHRLRMIQLSIENIPYFECSSIEIEKTSISYTITTLQKLKQQYDNIDLIIGYDNIIAFNKWKEPDNILKLANLVVMKRKPVDEPEQKDKYYKSAIFVETPTIEISSSDIKERIKKGLSIDFLVPDKVKEYIHKYNLYKGDKT
ncbi:MAG TPA: nicotinate (nicotinamide) nucleotide adenylyltransferase [Ignavibacteria bacterium]|nr:nicotinate (nicotinamide) nucleotide adenylyltransferase [Ignavibacteria bacterium]